MNNINIYEIIGLQDDHVHRKLEQLQPGEEIIIDAHTVRLDKFYEIENDEVHIGFKDIKSCYHFLSGLVCS